MTSCANECSDIASSEKSRSCEPKQQLSADLNWISNHARTNWKTKHKYNNSSSLRFFQNDFWNDEFQQWASFFDYSNPAYIEPIEEPEMGYSVIIGSSLANSASYDSSDEKIAFPDGMDYFENYEPYNLSPITHFSNDEEDIQPAAYPDAMTPGRSTSAGDGCRNLFQSSSSRMDPSQLDTRNNSQHSHQSVARKNNNEISQDLKEYQGLGSPVTVDSAPSPLSIESPLTKDPNQAGEPISLYQHILKHYPKMACYPSSPTPEDIRMSAPEQISSKVDTDLLEFKTPTSSLHSPSVHSNDHPDQTADNFNGEVSTQSQNQEEVTESRRIPSSTLSLPLKSAPMAPEAPESSSPPGKLQASDMAYQKAMLNGKAPNSTPEVADKSLICETEWFSNSNIYSCKGISRSDSNEESLHIYSPEDDANLEQYILEPVALTSDSNSDSTGCSSRTSPLRSSSSSKYRITPFQPAATPHLKFSSSVPDFRSTTFNKPNTSLGHQKSQSQLPPQTPPLRQQGWATLRHQKSIPIVEQLRKQSETPIPYTKTGSATIAELQKVDTSPLTSPFTEHTPLTRTPYAELDTSMASKKNNQEDRDIKDWKSKLDSKLGMDENFEISLNSPLEGDEKCGPGAAKKNDENIKPEPSPNLSTPLSSPKGSNRLSAASSIFGLTNGKAKSSTSKATLSSKSVAKSSERISIPDFYRTNQDIEYVEGHVDSSDNSCIEQPCQEPAGADTKKLSLGEKLRLTFRRGGVATLGQVKKYTMSSGVTIVESSHYDPESKSLDEGPKKHGIFRRIKTHIRSSDPLRA